MNFAPLNPEITTHNTTLNPATTKRRDYTPGLACASLPPDSGMAKGWKDLALQLRALYTALGNHEAMRPNLDQTFNTPANSKNGVYFMWDFVGKTLHYLYMVPAKLEGLTKGQQEMRSDTLGRSVMAANLILDIPPGMLAAMTVGGPVPKMGKEVEDAARAVLADQGVNGDGVD